MSAPALISDVFEAESTKHLEVYVLPDWLLTRASYPRMSTTAKVESKAEAEALIPQFALTRVLNQDQSGRRLTLLGSISRQPALLTLERSAFPLSDEDVASLLRRITSTVNLGANDIYRWYMSNLNSANLHGPSITTTPPDLKINLIYPCTPSHIRKYSTQRIHYVLETPRIYNDHVRPYIHSQLTAGRLDWIFNILSGLTEQEDVVLRSSWDNPDNSGFLILPDLNWDRSTITSLHLLALVQRRDIQSIRDLKKEHVPWLRKLRDEICTSVAGQYETDSDEIKLYCHYHPTYYHFHVHVVHVMLEPEGGTQSVGKAWSLDVLIEWLDSVQSEEQGLDGVSLGYNVGEQSELWTGLWEKLKMRQEVTLNKTT